MSDKKRLDLNLPLATGTALPGTPPMLKIKGEFRESTRRPAVDLVFVIDTTGSMNDKIEGILSTCSSFLDAFGALALDSRVGLVAFGDLTVAGDRIDSSAFSSDLETIRSSLRGMPRFSGGGNEGESSFEALQAALRLEYRPRAVKALVLVTDEPALQHTIKASEITRQLRDAEILTYVISPPLEYFKEMAATTGGKWLQVTATADFAMLLHMLRELAASISKVVADIHRIANGSVREYLRLGPSR